MVYQGSKNRISKWLIPLLNKYNNKYDTFYDLFCGGCNVIDKVNYKYRIANDINPYLVDLFKFLQVNPDFEYEDVSLTTYKYVKENKDTFENWYVGYVGYIFSYAGKFFGGYHKTYQNRDYSKQRFNNIKKQMKNLKDVSFLNYKFEMFNPRDCIIYLDPPYINATGYKYENYNYKSLEEKCIEWNKNNIVILLSEINNPNPKYWKEISSCEQFTTLNKKKIKRIEKLFIWEPKNDA